MHAEGQQNRGRNPRLLLAQLTCLLLGVGLLLWGMAPALVECIVSGKPQNWADLLANTTVLALGAAFVGLHVLMRRRVRWAAWVAFLLSASVVSVELALATADGMQLSNSFLLLLSGSTSFATWLAIGAFPRAVDQAATQKTTPIRVAPPGSSSLFRQPD